MRLFPILNLYLNLTFILGANTLTDVLYMKSMYSSFVSLCENWKYLAEGAVLMMRSDLLLPVDTSEEHRQETNAAKMPALHFVSCC